MTCPRPVILTLAAAVLGGCGSDFHFYDRVDSEFDFRIFGGHSAHLHPAYVNGAKFTVGVEDDHGRDDEDFRDCELRSSDEDVFALGESRDDEHQVEAEAHALSPGIAELELIGPDGSVLAAHEIEVRLPDRVELGAAAPLFLGRKDVEAHVDHAQVLVEGLATFQVRYFDGDMQLAGSGALAVRGEGSSVERTVWGEERDWLRLHPSEPGEQAVELLAGGEPFTTITYDAVEDIAVADIELHGDNESKADDGDWLVVIAQALDDDGERIFGIDFDWQIAGIDQSETGDMYRYEFDRSQAKTAIARFDDLEVSAEIHADRGYVDSSNEAIGCSVGGRSGWAGLLVLVAACARRRRAR
ncbi:MAG TPA: hypothetical protein VG755_08290 [Nannocystaceae bacterium]|nr:hypothetical protein [Nannocystaceae bacterium]